MHRAGRDDITAAALAARTDARANEIRKILPLLTRLER